MLPHNMGSSLYTRSIWYSEFELDPQHPSKFKKKLADIIF